jgi:hypothetical protein
VVALLIALIGVPSQIAICQITGFDHGFSVRANHDLQVYRFAALRQAIHLADSPLTYRFQYGAVELVRIGNKSYIGLDLPIVLVATLATAAINRESAKYVPPVIGLLNSDLEINLDRLHRAKLLFGTSSEIVVTKDPDVGRHRFGVIAAPHVGIHVVAGPFDLQAFISYNYQFRLGAPERSLQWSGGGGMFSGPEFNPSGSPMGFMSTH